MGSKSIMITDLLYLASLRGLLTNSIIDPVALAVELVRAGESVASAASLCGVNRTTLHRKIAALPITPA
jgi:transcriptional regulator of acetoin/glycerol metabolism